MVLCYPTVSPRTLSDLIYRSRQCNLQNGWYSRLCLRYNFSHHHDHAEKTYNNLDITIEESLKNRRDGFEGVQTCRKHETLCSIMERIVKAEVHRLVIVDDEKRVTGVVSLSDILSFLVLRPVKELKVKRQLSASSSQDGATS